MLLSFILAAQAAAPVPDKPAPEFEFKEFRGRGLYNEQSLIDMGCDQEPGARVYTCSRQDTIAGRWAYLQFTIADRKLASLRISGFDRDLPAVIPELRGKYGLPCEMGTEEVSNRLGGRFTSRTFTWCFATGKLVLRERDTRIDAFSLTYSSFEQPSPAARPPSDF